MKREDALHELVIRYESDLRDRERQVAGISSGLFVVGIPVAALGLCVLLFPGALYDTRAVPLMVGLCCIAFGYHYRGKAGSTYNERNARRDRASRAGVTLRPD